MLRSNSRSQRKHFVFVSKFSIRVSFLGRARVSMTNRLGELSMTRWYPTESDSEVSPGLLIAGSEIILKIKYSTWSKVSKSLYNNKLYFSIDENLDIYLGGRAKAEMAAYLFAHDTGVLFQVFSSSKFKFEFISSFLIFISQKKYRRTAAEKIFKNVLERNYWMESQWLISPFLKLFLNEF